MNQYSIYTNTNPSSKALYPFLMDVQSPFLDSLETRLVIPLALKSRFSDKVIKNLTPIVNVNSSEYLILTPQMAAISKKSLGILVEDCSSRRNEILSSIDFLITGF
jgi:toxin CcdB